MSFQWTDSQTPLLKPQQIKLAVRVSSVWVHVGGWAGWFRKGCLRLIPPIPHPATQWTLGWSAGHSLLCSNYSLISLWLCRASTHWAYRLQAAGTARVNNNMAIQDTPSPLSFRRSVDLHLTCTATVYWDALFLCLFFSQRSRAWQGSSAGQTQAKLVTSVVQMVALKYLNITSKSDCLCNDASYFYWSTKMVRCWIFTLLYYTLSLLYYWTVNYMSLRITHICFRVLFYEFKRLCFQ